MDEEYVEAVLSVVERIPFGRVMAYGAIADIVAEQLGRGGPRTVGTVMAQYGGGVPWWRVVAASGAVPRRSAVAALRELAAEGTPMRNDQHVDMRLATWHPDVTP